MLRCVKLPRLKQILHKNLDCFPMELCAFPFFAEDGRGNMEQSIDNSSLREGTCKLIGKMLVFASGSPLKSPAI